MELQGFESGTEHPAESMHPFPLDQICDPVDTSNAPRERVLHSTSISLIYQARLMRNYVGLSREPTRHILSAVSVACLSNFLQVSLRA